MLSSGHALKRRPGDVWMEFSRSLNFFLGQHWWVKIRAECESNDFFARRWPTDSAVSSTSTLLSSSSSSDSSILKIDGDEVPRCNERKYHLARSAVKSRMANSSKYELRDASGMHIGEKIDTHYDPCFHVSLEGKLLSFPFEAFSPSGSSFPGNASLREMFDYDVWSPGSSRQDKMLAAVNEGWFKENPRLGGFAAPRCDDSRFNVSFFVNVSLVCRLVTDVNVPCCPFEWLLVACSEGLKLGTMYYPGGKNPNIPGGFSQLSDGDENEDDGGSVLSTQLYPHQTMALKWMRSIERDGKAESESKHCPKWICKSTGLLVDFERNRLIPSDSERFRMEIRSDGGILGDEMGLGKTLVLLSLAFGRDDSTNYATRGNAPSFPVSSVCDPEALYRDSVFPTKATLIVSPSHLVSQWSEEARKHVPEEQLGQVITITTTSELKSVTYRRIQNASIVLVSASLFENSNARLTWMDFVAPVFHATSSSSSSSTSSSTGSLKKPAVKRASRKKAEEDKNTLVSETSEATLRETKPRSSEKRKRLSKLTDYESCAWKSMRCGNLARRKPLKKENHLADKLVSLSRGTLLDFRKRLESLENSEKSDQARDLLDRLLDSPSPNLLHFGWRRIVVDEAHEFLGDGNLFHILTFASARNRWLVSGTPLALLGNWRTTTRFLKFDPDYKQSKAMFKSRGLPDDGRDHRKSATFHGLLDHYYWRNTKTSAAEIASSKLEPAGVSSAFPFGAGIEHETVSVKLSPLEIAIYRQALAEGAGQERLVQICCHPQVSKHERKIVGPEELSMESIRRKLVQHHSAGIDAASDNLSTMRRRLNEEETGMKLLQDLELKIVPGEEEHPRQRQLLLEAVHVHQVAAQGWRAKIAVEEQRLSQLQSTLRFLQTVGSESSSEPECPICYGDSNAPQAILRICGHTACADCLRSAVRIQKRCPTCRASTLAEPIDSNFWIVAGTKNREPEPQDQLVSKVGSKIARLIGLLDEIRRASTPEAPNRTIVFSQFDSMLHKVGELLAQHGVKTVYAKGNVHSKTSSIRKFKTDPTISALLLSVEHSASGTNLQEATHVIFVDALLGDTHKARATMLQAIGRADRIGQKRRVKVYHLVSEETVEADLHNHLLPKLSQL